MKPLRKYTKAMIWFRDHNLPDGEYYEVCLYTSMIICFDKDGKEHTVPMVFIKQVTEYKEDRPIPVVPPPASPNITVTIGGNAPTRVIQAPRKGIAQAI